MTTPLATGVFYFKWQIIYKRIILKPHFVVIKEERMKFFLYFVIAGIFTSVAGALGYWYAVVAGGSTFWFSIPPMSWILSGLVAVLVYFIRRWVECMEQYGDAKHESRWTGRIAWFLLFPVLFFQAHQFWWPTMPAQVAYAGYWLDAFMLALWFASVVTGPMPYTDKRIPQGEACD